jgi:hypothetical protein
MNRFGAGTEMSKVFLTVLAAAILVFLGCGPRMVPPKGVCPGAESAEKLLSGLNLRAENAVALKANGKCLLRYYADGKPQLQSFPVRLWLNPPGQLYLQGDVAFNPRGIVLGSNEDEFWLSIKPGISTYWWGKWAEHPNFGAHALSPRILLEVFGIVALDGDDAAGEWSFSKEDAFDVLAKQNENGDVTKRVHVDSCTGLVWKIEYFDGSGKPVAVSELYKYKEASEGFLVPNVIKIINYGNGDEENSVRIVFDSVKAVELTEKQRRGLFVRPEPKGFKNVKKI